MRWSYPGTAKSQTSGVRCETSRRTPLTFAAGTKRTSHGWAKMRVAKSWKQGGLTGSASLSFDVVPEVNRLERPTRTCCEVEVLEDRVICGLFEETAAGSHESGAVCCDRRRDSREGWAKLWRSVLLGRVDQHWVHVGQRWAVALASINSCANGCDGGAVVLLRYWQM